MSKEVDFMPRKNRTLYPGAIYHVFDRGVDKQPVFHDDKDREKFLSILEELCFPYNFVLHAFCLMGNHYHILLQTYEANMPEIMQRVLCKYAKYFNTKYARVGYLFQDRYDDRNVYTEDYFVTLFRYFALNPVDDQVTKEPQDYVWSSYSDYYYKKNRYNFLCKDLFKALFNESNMSAEDVHDYVLCPKEELSLNYNFDTQLFRVKDAMFIPKLITNDERTELILEGIDALSLNFAKKRQMKAFFLKSYTTLTDKCILKLSDYSYTNSVSKICRDWKHWILDKEELLELRVELESKFVIPGVGFL
ncbi:MAG: transposase [Cyanobacteria bacterium]|nr:transposase [Cyanobacteriota bacterium]MDA1021524.1 transposase [Cyanobacteriota bacterium]